jgi:hypothetical protein
VFVGTLAEARATLAPEHGTSLEEIFFAATGDGAPGPGPRMGASEP